MEQFRADLRLALRGLAKRPGSALLIVLTLAVGIAVNTVMFSVVNGLLFKRVPFADRDRLAWINAQTRANHYGELTYPEFIALSSATRGPTRRRDRSTSRAARGLIQTESIQYKCQIKAERSLTFTRS